MFRCEDESLHVDGALWEVNFHPIFAYHGFSEICKNDKF